VLVGLNVTATVAVSPGSIGNPAVAGVTAPSVNSVVADSGHGQVMAWVIGALPLLTKVIVLVSPAPVL
jgi:hypothetical protein